MQDICKRREFNPWWGRSPRVGNGNPLKYSCLENPMERGAWWATVHRVTKSRTQLKWLSTHRKRIALLLCQANGDTAGSCLEKLRVHLERIVRSFIVIFQRGCRQLVDSLLMGGWWGKKESTSSIFRSSWSGVFLLVGSIPSLIINFSHLQGVSVSAEHLKGTAVCIPWWGTRTLPHGCLFLPGLAYPPFPSEQILESAHWNSSKLMEAEWRLFPVIKEMGDTERLLPRSLTGPAWYQLS